MGGPAIDIDDNLTNFNSNYNDLRTTGATLVDFNGTTYASLAAWQVTGRDVNSLSVDPLFINDTNLHLQLASPVLAQGLTNAFVTDDIDGETRPQPAATSYDMGADEIEGCQPLAGVYTIGGVSPDFPTIDSSVQAMILCGIDSAVVFNIRNGVYVEQTSIPDITGASALNTITYQSEGLDSSLVSVQWPSGTTNTNSYVVEWSGVDYLRFRHLTFERTGTNNFANVFLINNGSHNNRIDTCHIVGPIGTNAFQALVRSTVGSIDTGNVFNGNCFTGGSAGLYYEGGSTANLESGTQVTNNLFETNWTGIRARYQDGIVISGNRIFNDQITFFNGLALYDCNNGSQVFNNNIESQLGGFGMYINNCIGTSSAPARIYNNFVLIDGTGTASAIYMSGGSPSYQYIEHNTLVSAGYKYHFCTRCCNSECYKYEPIG